MNEDYGGRNKISMAIVSLLLSLMLWTVVQITQPPDSKRVETPIVMIDREKYASRFILPEDLGKTVVLVEGPADVVQNADDRFLQRNGVVVYVDLNDIRLGLRDYPLKIYKSPRSPYTFTLLSSRVSIDVREPRSRRLPVSVDTAGEIPEEKGFTYNGATTDPNMVFLRGARDAVDRVHRVHVYLDLATVDPGGYTMAPAEPLDDADNVVSDVTVSPQLVKVTPRVAPAGTSKTVLVEQTFKGRPAMGFAVTNYAVEPNQVAIQGPQEILSRLRRVPTRPINLDGLRTSTTFEIPLDLPAGVKTYSTRNIRVHVVIEPGRSENSVLPGSAP